MALQAVNEVMLRAKRDSRAEEKRSDEDGRKHKAAAKFFDFGSDTSAQRFFRCYLHLLSAATAVFLTGHSLFEMVFVPHLREFGGGLGGLRSSRGERTSHPHLHRDFVSVLRQATTSSTLGADGTDGILDDVLERTGSRRIPEEVVEEVWRFVRLGLQKDGGLELAEGAPSWIADHAALLRRVAEKAAHQQQAGSIPDLHEPLVPRRPAVDLLPITGIGGLIMLNINTLLRLANKPPVLAGCWAGVFQPPRYCFK